MAQHIVLGAISTSSSIIDKKDLGNDSHFKWDSIRNFIYLAEAFSSVHVIYDLFSGLTSQVSIYLFLLFALLIGMPYMCMEFFIKQYTGRIDFNEPLNPLLKGINCGILCVSAFHSLIHANDLADSVNFLIATMSSIPQWSDCSKAFARHLHFKQCIPTKNITLLCAKQTTSLALLSTHINYMVLFMNTDRSIITRKIFIIGVVWIINFFISTLSDHVLVKFFYVSFLLRNISTILAAIFVIFSAQDFVNPAMKDVMGFKFNKITVNSITTTPFLYVFGIGIVGVYDFGTLSPYTIVDNAVVIFTIIFIFLAFLRAILVRTVYYVVNRCIKINKMTYHYFLFGAMPLSADFLFSQRLFTMYLYVNLSMGLFTHLAAVNAALTKLLHTEFRKIKGIYISGMLCFFGFVMSIPVGMYYEHRRGYLLGLNNAMLVMALLKVAIIMYLYGVNIFSTDIHFWLNYKPTRYWTLTWAFLPIFFGWFVVARFVEIISDSYIKLSDETIISLAVTSFIVVVVIFIQIRTVAKFIAANNLTALFRSSIRYGPPDSDERKRRRKYDEALSVRYCTHNCVLLDDKFDCNHMPLTFKPMAEEEADDESRKSATSMTHIFEAGPIRKSRLSEMLDVHQTQD